jgi:hypothetical protein
MRMRLSSPSFTCLQKSTSIEFLIVWAIVPLPLLPAIIKRNIHAVLHEIVEYNNASCR